MKRCKAMVRRRGNTDRQGWTQDGPKPLKGVRYTQLGQCHRPATHGDFCWQHKEGK